MINGKKFELKSRKISPYYQICDINSIVWNDLFLFRLAFFNFNNIVSTKIYDKLDNFDFQIVNFSFLVMFLALHPMESISLNSFLLLEHLAMLLNSTLAKNC